MEINEILTRRSPAFYTVEELQFAIEKYIEKKKNQKVTVNIMKGMPEDGVLNQYDIMKLSQQYTDLMSAFTHVQMNYNK